MSELNQTELISQCRERGISASFSVSKLELAGALANKTSVPLGNPFDRDRAAIDGLLKHRPSLKTQMLCDFDHDRCPDIKVLACKNSMPSQLKDFYVAR